MYQKLYNPKQFHHQPVKLYLCLYIKKIYCLNSWGQVLLPTSEGQERFKKVLKVLKLLGTKN